MGSAMARHSYKHGPATKAAPTIVRDAAPAASDATPPILLRASGPGTSSRALAVHARTLELYAQMDLAAAVVADGYQVRGLGLWVDGERQARISLSDAGAGRTPYPFLHIYPQDRHERLLVDRLRQAGVEVEWDTSLVDFSQHGEGVTARILLPDGREATCEPRYLAGCDGAGSAVRKILGIGFPGGTYDQTFYVADVEAEGPPMNGDLNLDLDESDFLAIFPLDESRRARLVGAVREDVAQAGSLTFDDINSKAAESLGIKVKAVNWFSSYRVHHRVVDRFRKGRLFLLGDAAHIHSPAGGQGMNTGIGDAVNLAWKLRMALDQTAPDRLLDSFEQERIAFARRLVKTTDQAFSFATSQGRLARLVRTRIVPWGTPIAARLDPLRDYVFRTVSQLAIHYRGSLLSHGQAGEVHGGDRLPWLDLGNGRSNYDGFAALCWQVHVYGFAGHLLEDWCRQNGVRLHVFDWREEFSAAGLERDAAYLLRPDSYVATAVEDASPEALQSYLQDRDLRLPTASSTGSVDEPR
eukprot:g7594.t1